MLTSCEKCGENSEAKLDYKNKDVEKSNVICLSCDGVLDINIFVKRMMLQRGDIIERRQLVIPPNGIMYTCDSLKCRKSFSAEVNKKTHKVNCPFCKVQSNVSDITISLLESNNIYVGYSDSYFKNEDSSTSESKAINEAIEGQNVSNDPITAQIRPLDGTLAVKGKTKTAKKK